MSRGPSIPGPLSHPVIGVVTWASVAVVVLVGLTLVDGCARAGAQCPDCAPIMICDEWAGMPSASAAVSSSAAPVPSAEISR